MNRMVSNHDAALIAEKDAKSLVLRTESQLNDTYTWDEGQTHYFPPKSYMRRIPGVTAHLEVRGLENVESYVSANKYQYYTLINVWCLIIKAHGPYGHDMVEDRIKRDGLLKTIASAQEAAELLTHEEYDQIETFWSTVIGGLTMADALEVLRFPKRFSIESDVLAKQKLYDFLAWNRYMKTVNENTRYTYIVSRVKYWFEYCVAEYPLDGVEATARFTNGVSAECGNHITEKIDAWASPNFGDPLYPKITCYPDLACRDRSVFATVPKSYKTYRGIAYEPVEKQSLQQCIAKALVVSLNHRVGDNIPLSSQAVNATNLSDKIFASIDMSNASDGVGLALIAEIAPLGLYNDLIRARSNSIEYDPSLLAIVNSDASAPNAECRLHMLSSMGNGYTFAVESPVFWSIAMAATEEASLFLHKRITKTKAGKFPVFAYGDDLEVPTWAYETVIDWLTALGFKVNVSKSFSGTAFRESCGTDWFDNDIVTSMYWPRKVIKEDKRSMPSLIALQNRLCERGGLQFYWEAQRFLANQILRVVPKIGTVSVDEFLEYQLDGKVLIGPVSTVEEKEYYRNYSLCPGDGRSYSEKRKYVNVLRPKKKEVWCRTKHYAIRVPLSEFDINTYLYMEFLREGPLMVEEHTVSTPLSGESQSRFSDRICQKTDGFEIARVRLF